MPFTGQTRRALPGDFLGAAMVSSVSFEYHIDGKQDPLAFYDQLVANAPLALHRRDARYMDKYVAEADGKIVASLCATSFVIEMDGGDARMCGIGNVCSLPVYRRLGAVRAMLNDVLRDEHESGTEWSFLYPFAQGYYEKFGYALSDPDVIWSMSLRHITPQRDSRFNISMHEGGDEGLCDFQKAYERMSGFNMMVRRERCDYEKIINANPYKSNNFAFLCRDEAGEPRGYAVWHKRVENGQRTMFMTELVFDELPVLLALLNFATGYTSDYDRVRFLAPSCLNLEPVCTDIVEGGLKRDLVPCGMVRVIHIENALRCARLLGSGEASLFIADPTMGKEHSIGLKWRDGRMVDIGKTTLKPDASLDIGTFSALLLGRCDLVDCAYMPGVTIHNPGDLSSLFYRKRIHTKDHF